MDSKLVHNLRKAALAGRMGGFYSEPIVLKMPHDDRRFSLAGLIWAAERRMRLRAGMILTPGTVVTPMLYLPAPLDGESQLVYVAGRNDETFLKVGIHGNQDADIVMVGDYNDRDMDLTYSKLRVALTLSDMQKGQIRSHFLPLAQFRHELAMRDSLRCRACGEEGLVIMRGAVPACDDILYSRKLAVAIGNREGDSFTLYFACPHCQALGDLTGVQFRNAGGSMYVKDL